MFWTAPSENLNPVPYRTCRAGPGLRRCFAQRRTALVDGGSPFPLGALGSRGGTIQEPCRPDTQGGSHLRGDVDTKHRPGARFHAKAPMVAIARGRKGAPSAAGQGRAREGVAMALRRRTFPAHGGVEPGFGGTASRLRRPHFEEKIPQRFAAGAMSPGALGDTCRGGLFRI